MKKNTDLISMKEIYVLNEHELALVVIERCSNYLIDNGWFENRSDLLEMFAFLPKGALGEFYSDRALEACYFANKYIKSNSLSEQLTLYKSMIANVLAASGFIDEQGIKKQSASLNGIKSGQKRARDSAIKHRIWGDIWEDTIRSLLSSNIKVTVKNIDRIASETMILKNIKDVPTWNQVQRNIPKLVKKIKKSLNSS